MQNCRMGIFKKEYFMLLTSGNIMITKAALKYLIIVIDLYNFGNEY